MHDLIERAATYARYAWRGRWSVLGITWLVCLIGWAVVMLLPDRYRSSVRIYADTDRLVSPLVPGLAPSASVDNRLGVIQQTILSSPNLRRVVDMAGVLPLDASPEEVARAAREVRENTDVIAEEQNFFELRYVDGDPHVAQAVVQSLLDVFTNSGVGSRRGDIEATESLLDEQVDEAKRRLDEAEARLTRFIEENSEVVGGDRSYFRRLEELRREADGVRGDLALANAQRDQLEQQLQQTPRTLGANFVGGGVPQDSRQVELAAMRERLAELRARYTPQHPDVVATERTVARLEAELADAPAAVRAGPPNPQYDALRLQVGQARARVQSLEVELAGAEARAETLAAKAPVVPAAESELRNLTRDYEILKRGYEQLVQSRDSTRLAGALGERAGQLDFRIVEPPSLPQAPTAPDRLLLMAAVLAGGLIAGIAITLARGSVDAPFDSPRALHRAFDLRILGTISRFKRPVDRWRRRRQTAGFALCSGSLALLLVVLVVLERSEWGDRLRETVRPLVGLSTIRPAPAGPADTAGASGSRELAIMPGPTVMPAAMPAAMGVEGAKFPEGGEG